MRKPVWRNIFAFLVTVQVYNWSNNLKTTKIQCWIISTTKQAACIMLATTVGHFFYVALTSKIFILLVLRVFPDVKRSESCENSTIQDLYCIIIIIIIMCCVFCCAVGGTQGSSVDVLCVLLCCWRYPICSVDVLCVLLCSWWYPR